VCVFVCVRACVSNTGSFSVYSYAIYHTVCMWFQQRNRFFRVFDVRYRFNLIVML